MPPSPPSIPQCNPPILSQPPSFSLSPMHFCRAQHKDSTVHLECNFCHLFLKCRPALLLVHRDFFFFWGGSSLKSGNRIIPCVYTCSQMFSMCLHAEYIVIYSFCLVDGAFLQPVQCENHGRRQSPACFLHISRIHSRFSILNVNGGQLFKMY